DVLEAGEVVGVVQGGGELADAAADGGAGTAVFDDAAFDVALGRAAGAGELVEGEDFTGGDDGAGDVADDHGDVLPGGRRVAGGGEFAHDLVKFGVLRHLGGESRGVVLVEGVPLAGLVADHAFDEAIHGGLPVDG